MLLLLVRTTGWCQAPITNAASDSDGLKTTDSHSAPIWFLLFLLLLGVIASVVGYIGCFSVVQSTQKSTGPLSWLCLEAALSLLRMYIWGLNPDSDDAPPLEFVLKLDEEPPLPTCNMYSDEIETDKVLPLTRANQFLNSVTAFAGLIDRFEHPDLTLYYTLTRKRVPGIEPETTLGERILYITAFDHKERTTRIYTRGGTAIGFDLIESSIPVIDLEHGVLEVRLGRRIDSKNDPIVGVDAIRLLLEEHYQSIMDPYSTTKNTVQDHRYIIENTWTMKRADTTSAPQRESETGPRTSEDVLHNPSARDHQYLEGGRIERMVGSLYATRGKWIEDYMRWVIQETRDRFEAEKKFTRRVDGATVTDEEKADGKRKATSSEEGLDAKMANMDPESEEIELQFVDEQCWMEKLLVFEVEEWEEQVWNRVDGFLASFDAQEKERLTREWRANCWKRLDAHLRAMNARMETAKTKATAATSEKWQPAHAAIREAWEIVTKRFMEDETPSRRISMPPSYLDHQLRLVTEHSAWFMFTLNPAQQRRLQRQREEMASRLTREMANIKDRLNQGLERCSEFWSDEKLLECRHSQSKWLILFRSQLKAPLEVYSHALKGNENIIDIFFGDFKSHDDYRSIADTIRDLPSVTTIWVEDRRRLPDIQRDTPLLINNYSGSDIETFLDNDPQLQLVHSRGTFMFFSNPTRSTKDIAISFVGPTSGDLRLRLTHHCNHSDATLTIKGTSFQLPVPSSLTADDVTLHATPSEPGQPSFKPGIRNSLIIQVTAQSSYSIHDVQLLDQSGGLYNSAQDNA